MTEDKDKQTAMVCVLGALGPGEQRRQRTVGQDLLASVRETRELKDGYAMRFPAESEIIRLVAEFITLERQCCPFLSFELEVASGGAVWLRLRGGDGVKTFLENELSL